MKIYIFAVLLLLLPLTTLLRAYDWTGAAVAREEMLQVLSVSNNETETNITLQDKNSNVFLVDFLDPMDDNTMSRILKLKNDFYTWPELKINRIQFRFSDGELEMTLLPDRFLCNNTNVMPYLPAGMLFRYTDTLHYNFRMVKENLFLKLEGIFLNRIEFSQRLLDALRNPLAYIKKQDPEYFMAKLDLLQGQMDALTRENNTLKWALITLINEEKITEENIAKVVKIKKGNPRLNPGQIRDILSKEKVKLSKGQISVILTVYFSEYED